MRKCKTEDIGDQRCDGGDTNDEGGDEEAEMTTKGGLKIGSKDTFSCASLSFMQPLDLSQAAPNTTNDIDRLQQFCGFQLATKWGFPSSVSPTR